jgi:PEGA domain
MGWMRGGAAAIASWLLGAPAALAQPAKGDQAAAEALFRQGRDLVAAGDHAAGCPKFDASFAMHPSASTLLNIAKCKERDGKLASAWTDYKQALTLNRETKGQKRQKELEEIATKGISALEPRLPKLRVVVTAPPAGLEVLRDGVVLQSAALGEALPADPGKHEVRFSAPGHRAETRSVTLEEGKTTTVEVSLQADAAPAPAKEPEGGVPLWVWITGGAGLVLTGVGVAFLVDDLSAIDALDENCRANDFGRYCAAGYDYESDNARQDRSFGLFVGLGGAGVIAIGAAVVGLVTAPGGSGGARASLGERSRPSKTSPATGMAASPWIGSGSAGATIRGRF